MKSFITRGQVSASGPLCRLVFVSGLKIQMSEATAKILTNLGGYHIHRRRERKFKNIKVSSNQLSLIQPRFFPCKCQNVHIVLIKKISLKCT